MIVNTKSKRQSAVSLTTFGKPERVNEGGKYVVETYSYNLIDVRAIREDGVVWLFLADLQPFFERHIYTVIATTPEDEKRSFLRDEVNNPGKLHSSVTTMRAIKESYFLDQVCVRKTGGMQYVCYQCGGEIQSGGTVKKSFSVCYDGATEKRIARFHASCYRG